MKVGDAFAGDNSGMKWALEKQAVPYHGWRNHQPMVPQEIPFCADGGAG